EIPGIATDVAFDPLNGSVAYAAIRGSGVWKFTNGTWNLLGGGLPTSSIGRINFSIAQSDARILYVSIHDSTTDQLLGIVKTTDGGTSWAQLSAFFASCSNQCWYDMVIAVHPSNPQTVYFGGVNLYQSTNGGVIFSDITNGIHVDQHAFAFDPRDPNVVYAGNDGGIYKSTNGGTSWQSLNTN